MISRFSKWQKGFTLIELLVVIAILAILSVAVVLVVNPADIIRQSRDSNRLTDLSNLSKAINTFGVTNAGSFVGTSSIVYVSIADATTTCANLGLPTLPTGWIYNCATSSTLIKTDGTGWIPINFDAVSYGSPISKLPVDPQNTTSTGLYYQYIPGGSYILKANLESTKYAAKAATDGGLSVTGYEVGSDLALGPKVFPDNWIKIPGNSAFGTSDFYVMKYEAKCATASNNALLTTPNTGYNTLYDSQGGSAACTAANGKYVTSAADGYPIARISHNTAKTYCASIGAHLLTNEEYMTIARNAEQVNGNWSTSVGSGYLYSGHNDNSPATALTASQDDADYYYGTGNSSGNQRRVLTLSNGQSIWDLAGNVWEHVQRTAADIVTTIDLPACSDGVAGWGWCQYGATTAPYVSAYTADVAQASVGPSNTNWNSTQGMGQVYTYKNGTDQATTVFIRGGRWDSASDAGAFALHLSWDTGNTNNEHWVSVREVVLRRNLVI